NTHSQLQTAHFDPGLTLARRAPSTRRQKCEQLPLYKTCAMRNEMRTLLAAAAFAVAGAAAQAADVAALVGHVAKLDADSSALVYYTAAPDGFHVVVTTQQGLTDQVAVVRLETVLTAGQSAAVSIPRAAGEAPARIVVSNAGDHLHIAKLNAAV